MKRSGEAVREHTPRAGGSAEDKLYPMATTRWRGPTDISGAIAGNRREFLKSAVGLSAAGAILGFTPLRAAAIPPRQKVIVITFGGGARDEETWAPEGRENIPNLLGKLLPQSTFFGRVENRGILGHYVATASLATGVYETFNNFAATPPGKGIYLGEYQLV